MTHPPAVVGLDFDNTLVSYDRLLVTLAGELGWAAGAVGKKAIRDAIRASAEGDLGWQRLQGMIYGPRMAEAEMVDGVAPFLDACRARGVRVVIVSHKTDYAGVDPTRTPLRDAARAWMAAQGFFERFAIAPDDVHFAATKAEKLARIGEVGVPLFIDDLEEILSDPAFPAGVERFLFHPGDGVPVGPFRVFRDFDAIGRELFGA